MSQHQEIQIAPGVYITDFRPNATLKGIEQPKQELTNDVGLLLDDIHTIESKCQMLEFTIKEIKQEENWEKDGDFREAVEQDWSVLIKFSGQMKEKILKLMELKYQPESAKIEKLLNIDRIQTRQSTARSELMQILKARQCALKQEMIEKKEEEHGIYL